MENGQIDPSKIEKALNTWLENVEDQVNSIEEMVQNKAFQGDMKNLEHKLNEIEQDQDDKMAKVEKLCEQMTEKAVESHEELRQRLMDIEDRHVMITQHLDAQMQGQTSGGKNGKINQSSILQ